MQEIQRLFNNNQWDKLCVMHSPQAVAQSLSFRNGMILAYKFLYNDSWDENMQEYAVSLLYALREIYQNDWKVSWKNEAFLGTACDVTLKYDERYKAYKNALERAASPPPELLIELARCCFCPGSPPITYDESIELLEKAVKIHPYIEAIGLLKALYSSKRNIEKEAYWSEMLKKMATTGEKAPPIEPPSLKEE